jgi:hypothetical protein
VRAAAVLACKGSNFAIKIGFVMPGVPKQTLTPSEFKAWKEQQEAAKLQVRTLPVSAQRHNEWK